MTPGQLEHALTVLGRAHPQHSHLADTLTHLILIHGAPAVAPITVVAPALAQPGPLLDALDQLIDVADIDQLQQITYALPEFSLILQAVSVRAATRLVERQRGTHADGAERDRATFAKSVNILAIRLGQAGRRAEGLTAAQEAVEVYEELARSDPDRYYQHMERAKQLLGAVTEADA